MILHGKTTSLVSELWALSAALTDGGFKGGTLTSGIDCWMKGVIDYPIINNGTKKHMDGGSYHEDDLRRILILDHVGRTVVKSAEIGVTSRRGTSMFPKISSHIELSPLETQDCFELTYALEC